MRRFARIFLLLPLFLSACGPGLIFGSTFTPTPTITPTPTFTSTPTKTLTPTITLTPTNTITPTPTQVVDSWIYVDSGITYNPSYLLNGQIALNGEMSNYHWEEIWRGIHRFNVSLYNQSIFPNENDFITSVKKGNLIVGLYVPIRAHGATRPDKYSAVVMKVNKIDKLINPSTIIIKVLNKNDAEKIYADIYDKNNLSICLWDPRCIGAVYFEIVSLPGHNDWYLQLTLTSYSAGYSEIFDLVHADANIASKVNGANYILITMEHDLNFISSENVRYDSWVGAYDAWPSENYLSFKQAQTLPKLFTAP